MDPHEPTRIMECRKVFVDHCSGIIRYNLGMIKSNPKTTLSGWGLLVFFLCIYNIYIPSPSTPHPRNLKKTSMDHHHHLPKNLLRQGHGGVWLWSFESPMYRSNNNFSACNGDGCPPLKMRPWKNQRFPRLFHVIIFRCFQVDTCWGFKTKKTPIQLTGFSSAVVGETNISLQWLGKKNQGNSQHEIHPHSNLDLFFLGLDISENDGFTSPQFCGTVDLGNFPMKFQENATCYNKNPWDNYDIWFS